MVQAGKPSAAVERLTEALDVARRAGSGAFLMDRIVPYLAGAQGEIGRYDDAKRILDEQEQALVRAAGADHPFRVGVLHVRSGVAAASNDASGELAYARAAIELALRVAPDDAQLVSVYNNACDALVHLERYEEALDECAKAIEQGERLNGPRGNSQAIPLITSGEALMGLHRPAEASVFYQKVIDRSDAAHPWYLELALSGLGEALLGAGKPQGAIAPLERALAMEAESQLLDAEHEVYVAEARFALAQALRQTGVRGARIAALISASASAFRRRGRESRALQAESWLSAQR
jgi:tetratricopeptide (TPR) repeat protein